MAYVDLDYVFVRPTEDICSVLSYDAVSYTEDGVPAGYSRVCEIKKTKFVPVDPELVYFDEPYCVDVYAADGRLCDENEQECASDESYIAEGYVDVCYIETFPRCAGYKIGEPAVNAEIGAKISTKDMVYLVIEGSAEPIYPWTPKKQFLSVGKGLAGSQLLKMLGVFQEGTQNEPS